MINTLYFTDVTQSSDGNFLNKSYQYKSVFIAYVKVLAIHIVSGSDTKAGRLGLLNDRSCRVICVYYFPTGHVEKRPICLKVACSKLNSKIS